MYITNEKLLEKIAGIAKEADRRSGHSIAFEEYIAIPVAGNIILRFMLNGEDYTLDDLDRYERMLAEIAGDEFLVDFMGSVYRKVGVDYSGLWDRLVRMNTLYADETLSPSVHSQGIREDGAELLKTAGLDPDRDVWEIQVEDGAFTLMLFGETNRTVAEITEPVKMTVMETDRAASEGLLRATAYCRRNGISLARLLLE